MPTQNVNLSDRQTKFIRRNVDSGHFRSASEVVRAALRLLEQQQRMDRLKLQTLRKLSEQAFADIDRGDHVVLGPADLDQFVAQLAAKRDASKPR